MVVIQLTVNDKKLLFNIEYEKAKKLIEGK